MKRPTFNTFIKETDETILLRLRQDLSFVLRVEVFVPVAPPIFSNLVEHLVDSLGTRLLFHFPQGQAPLCQDNGRKWPDRQALRLLARYLTQEVL